jgi:hypothetical protein
MRLLIDECVDERLRLLFPGYECQTARFANLAALKNGRRSQEQNRAILFGGLPRAETAATG